MTETLHHPSRSRIFMGSSRPARSAGTIGGNAARRTVLLLIGLGTLALASVLAVPAQAQVVKAVSNTGQSSASDTVSLRNAHAQAFRTGADAGNYQVDSIEAEFATGITGSADQIFVQLHRAAGGNPGSIVASLSIIEVPIDGDGVPILDGDGVVRSLHYSKDVKAGVNKFSRWGVSRTRPVILQPNTTYFVMLFGGSETTTASLKTTTSDAEDSGGRAGWTIGDNAFERSWRSTSDPKTWTSAGNALKIGLNLKSYSGPVARDSAAQAVDERRGDVRER